MSNETWFNVDRKGLQKLALRRGIEYVLFELYQNAADQEVTQIDMWFRHDGGRNFNIDCSDDDPNGFADLAHAYTMFADSTKKSDPTKRGRFNLGEKLVLACCYRAQILTTTGTVTFNEDGTRKVINRTTNKVGSTFLGDIKNLITVAEFNTACEAFMAVIPRHGVKLMFNGMELTRPKSIESITGRLPTQIADAEGILRTVERETTIDVFEVGPLSVGWIYEMGIPVVETGDKFHYDVQQKIPVNLDRDNVSPAYLRKIRTLVFNATADRLTAADVNSSFVKDATESRDVQPGPLAHFVDLKFGTQRVSYDPSDPEANKLAVVKGYQIVHGGTMSSEQWDNIRKIEAIKPAGQVTPSPKPFSPGGKPLQMLQKITENHRRLERYVRFMAWQAMATTVDVVWADDPGWGFFGCYKKSSPTSAAVLHINVAVFEPGAWEGPVGIRIDDFLIHEFAHEHCGDHLDEMYHADLTRLGAVFKDITFQQRDKLLPFYDI